MKKKKNKKTRKKKKSIMQKIWELKRRCLLAGFVLSMLLCVGLFAKGKKMADTVIAVVDWSRVVAESPYAQEGDKVVNDLWKREEARIVELAKQLQEQLDAKPPQEKQLFEEQAKKRISEEIQKSSLVVQQETSRYVNLTINTIRDAIAKYCKDNKIDLVINVQAGVIYSNEVLDITDEIIKIIRSKK